MLSKALRLAVKAAIRPSKFEAYAAKLLLGGDKTYLIHSFSKRCLKEVREALTIEEKNG